LATGTCRIVDAVILMDNTNQNLVELVLEDLDFKHANKVFPVLSSMLGQQSYLQMLNLSGLKVNDIILQELLQRFQQLQAS